MFSLVLNFMPMYALGTELPVKPKSKWQPAP